MFYVADVPHEDDCGSQIEILAEILGKQRKLTRRANSPSDWHAIRVGTHVMAQTQAAHPSHSQEAPMLVLSRKLNQSIHIGDGISIRVVRIKGNSIQLGIDAPKDVHVVRSELLERDARQPTSAELLAALRVISQSPHSATCPAV